MTTERTNTLTLPLAILASVAAGSVLGHLFTSPDSKSTALTTVTIPDARELIDAMHALRDELSHTREPHNDLATPPVTSARVDATQPSPDPSVDIAKELRDATAEFVQAVGELHNAVRPNRTEEPPPVFPNVQPDPTLIDAESKRPYQDLYKTYLFWTYQQVVSRFGAPSGTELQKGPSFKWWYQGTPDGPCSLTFYFTDGRVYGVDCAN